MNSLTKGRCSNNAIPFNNEYYIKRKRVISNNLLSMLWLRYIRKYKKTGNLLEVGCGAGLFLKFAEEYYQTFGLDISKYGLAHAQVNTKDTNLFLGDSHFIPVTDSVFDIIIAFDIVEHLPHPKKFFTESFRVLKQGGILIIKTPNLESFGYKVKKKDWFGYKDTSHTSLLNPTIWKKQIDDAGFDVIDEGSDSLWDFPYFKSHPSLIQNQIFRLFCWLSIFSGAPFFHWSRGENLIIIAKRED